MKTKIFYFAIIIFLVFSCNNEAKKNNIEKTKGEIVKIGYIPIAECLPLYTAVEKGYFESEGIKVELIPQSGGPTIFKELNANNIDIGFSNIVSLIKNNGGRNKYQSIGVGSYETTSNTNHSMFTNSNISKDLSISKFAVNARYNIEELMIRKYIIENNITLNDNITKNIISIPFPKMISQLNDKEVDYACMVEPFISSAKINKNIMYVNNQYPLHENDEILVATYVSKIEFIESNKIIINKIISAMNKAIEDISYDEFAVRDFLKKYTKIPQEKTSTIPLAKFKLRIATKDINYILGLMTDERINYDQNFLKASIKVVPDDMIYGKR